MSKNPEKLYVCDIKTLEQESIFDGWYQKMPLRRREKIRSLRRSEDRRRSLAAGIALQTALADLPHTRPASGDTAIHTEETMLREGSCGKPYLPGRGVFFNLSHSGSYAVCAVSDREIGVDIEHPRRMRDSLIRYISVPEEIEALRSFVKESEALQFIAEEREALQSFAEKDAVPLRLWTIKESVMKYYGLGMTLSPKHIRVRLAGNELRVSLAPEAASLLPDGAALPENLRLCCLFIEDSPLSLCTAMEPFAGEIVRICP